MLILNSNPGFGHQKDSFFKTFDSNRYMWQQPKKLLDVIGVKKGMTIADVGAGEGYFTLRLARKVGYEGKVYANDINESFLEKIRNSCKKEGFNNVITILGNSDDPLLPEGKIDMVLMVNVMHLLENPSTFIKNIRPSLKPEGCLIIVQWDDKKIEYEKDENFNIENYQPWTISKLLSTIYESGFSVFQIENFLPMQYILLCRPIYEVK